MTNAKTTKRALFTSAMSMLLCVSMLIGTTFAWFTDSATSANNKIVAGKLDVKLLMGTGENTYTDISESKSPIFGTGSIAQDNNAETLWEPGKTQVAYLAIENAGNLDLKYNVNLIVKNVEKNLHKAMEYAIIPDAKYGDGSVTGWTDGNTVELGAQLVSGNEDVELKKGVTHYFALAIHMNKDAGNEYQEGKVDFDITVNATQLNSEEDSFNNTYDKEATYELSVNDEGKYETNSMAGLAAVAELASSDSSITSVDYVDPATGVTTEVPVASSSTAFEAAIDSNKEIVVLTSGDYQMPDGSESTNLKGKELTVVGTENTVIDVSNVDTRDQFVTGATMVFDGVTLNFDNGTKIYMGFANTENLIYRNCHITGMQMLNGENVTFENCVLDSSANTGEPHAVWTYGAKNISFTDCKFIYGNRAVNCYKDQDIDGGKQIVNFKNCTFATTDANSEGAVEINSSAFSIGIEVNMEGCTAPANGPMAYVSPWDSTNGAKTTINIK